MLGVAVELALVVHDHVEVTFKEGRRSGWICHKDLAGSLVRPAPTVLFVNLFKELDVGYPFL
jgi:hypothetical protein